MVENREPLLRPDDALEAFEKGRYSVALLDLGVPGTPGDQLARAMKDIDPDFVAILITGWEIVKGDPRLDVFDHHIQKPFGFMEIQELVSNCIECWHASR